MSVSGVGGPSGLGNVEDPRASGGAAAPSAPGSRAAPARGSAAAIPVEVREAVLEFDRGHHDNRSVPGRSHGRIVDGRKEADGSWTVRVGTIPEGAGGPVRGAEPRDVVAYVWREGSVRRAGERDARLDGASAAGRIKSLLTDPSIPEKDASIEATRIASAFAGGVVERTFLSDYVPSRWQDPERVAAFKSMLDQLEADGLLDDLRRRLKLSFVEEVLLDQRPHRKITAAIEHCGTEKQKAIWNDRG